MWRDQVTARRGSVRFAVCFMTCFLSYADDPALESFMNFDGMQSWLQHFVFGSLLVQPTDCMPKPHSQNSVFPSLLLKKKKRFYDMHATLDTRMPRIVRHVCDLQVILTFKQSGLKKKIHSLLWRWGILQHLFEFSAAAIEWFVPLEAPNMKRSFIIVI